MSDSTVELVEIQELEQPPFPMDHLDEAKDDRTNGGAEAMSQWQLIRRQFAKHNLAVISLYMLGLLYFVAIFADFFAPYSTSSRHLDYQYCPPQLVQWSFSDGLHIHAMELTADPITFRKTYTQRQDQPVGLSFLAKGESYRLWNLIPMQRRFLMIDSDQTNSAAGGSGVAENGDMVEPTFFFLGADKYGRDILSRMLFGARISLSVGLIGVGMTFAMGMFIGGISGYVGGKVDNIIQRGIEIINAFPQLPLWLALGALVPADWSPLRTYFAITVVLSLLGWTGLARVVRGKILSLREEDYAVAARLLGASHGRVLFRHLLPGFASHIIVALSLTVPSMILAETSLSFLGLGLRPPIVSWGVMLQDCMDIQAVRYYPWLLLPVVFIIITVMSFNFVGDGLRDAADPYASK